MSHRNQNETFFSIFIACLALMGVIALLAGLGGGVLLAAGLVSVSLSAFISALPD